MNKEKIIMENEKLLKDEEELKSKPRIDDLAEYKQRDKFIIWNNRLYQLSSEKEYDKNQNNDDGFIVLKQSISQTVYYKLVSPDIQQITIQLEQYKINEKIAQAQIEKISSINAKLTFFVVLTVVNIVASIIIALR